MQREIHNGGIPYRVRGQDGREILAVPGPRKPAGSVDTLLLIGGHPNIALREMQIGNMANSLDTYRPDLMSLDSWGTSEHGGWIRYRHESNPLPLLPLAIGALGALSGAFVISHVSEEDSIDGLNPPDDEGSILDRAADAVDDTITAAGNIIGGAASFAMNTVTLLSVGAIAVAALAVFVVLKK